MRLSDERLNSRASPGPISRSNLLEGNRPMTYRYLRFATVVLCVLLAFLNLALDVSFVRDIRTVLARRDRPLSLYSKL